MDFDKAAEYWIEKDKNNVKLDEKSLKERIEKVISHHKVCSFATSCKDFVRNTPLEFIYSDDSFYFFSEGGIKFKALKENKNVALSMFEENAEFGNLEGLQVSGTAEIIEPFCEEYNKICEIRKIPVEALKKLPSPMNLIKVVPEIFDLLDSSLKKEGFSTRQHWSK